MAKPPHKPSPKAKPDAMPAPGKAAPATKTKPRSGKHKVKAKAKAAQGIANSAHQPDHAAPLSQSAVEVMPEGKVIRPGRGRPPSMDVDWRQVREDFETTQIGVAALCRHHSIRSDTSVKRKIKLEGWRRDIVAIAARLVTEGVARTAGAPKKPKSEFVPSASSAQIRAHDGAQIPPIPDSAGNESGTPSEASEASAATHAHGKTAAEQAEYVPRRGDDRDLHTVKGMAEIHTRAIAQQVDAAEEMFATGVGVLRHIKTLMLAPNGSQALADACARMILVSDKDTLANIMKSCASILDAATMIKRRALGLEAAKGGVVTLPSDGQQRSLEEMMKRLAPTTLMDVRRAAQEIARLPPMTHDPIEDEEA